MKYYIRDTEFEFSTLAEARKKAKELAKTATEDVVICIKDTDAVKDVYPCKKSIEECIEEKPVEEKNEEKANPKFVVELFNKQTLVRSLLAKGLTGEIAQYDSFESADIAAKNFLSLTNSASTFSYLVRIYQ